MTECGRDRTYRGGCRCVPCRKAHTEAMREQREARYAARKMVGGVLVTTSVRAEHGRPSTFQLWGCRCTPCTEAHSANGIARRRQLGIGAQRRDPASGRLLRSRL